MDRISILSALLRELESKDPTYQVFGASTHRYKLNPPVSTRDLASFESRYSVKLPSEYREFLLKLGNGGAGPDYGLLSLTDSVTRDSTLKPPEFLATPFPFVEAFNPYSRTATDDEMFDDKYITGSLALAHQGCGYYDRLVVTGAQRGMVWCDGRVSDQGVAPVGSDFFDWYHSWLTTSLEEIR